MLPRFLLADNSQELPETVFVVHTDSPKFIVECDIDDFNSSQTIHWIDSKPEEQKIIDNLIEEAEDFYNDELANQEELYDQEFDEE
ncbi:MAG: hypothetical protein N4A49_03805 [Marinifilaceae bacterium]|jgi:hypothetical protein|nr:hypothetical protein [Marinifilaceae bacterium]